MELHFPLLVYTLSECRFPSTFSQNNNNNNVRMTNDKCAYKTESKLQTWKLHHGKQNKKNHSSITSVKFLSADDLSLLFFNYKQKKKKW